MAGDVFGGTRLALVAACVMSSSQDEAIAFGMVGPNLEGLRTLTSGAEITFIQYVRQVLPLDGYVFWLKTQQMTVAGSLHVSASKQQNEDETLSVNRVIFSTGTEVQQFNVIQPNTLWIGCAQGIKFAFSQSGPRFVEAGLFHYVGDAVYPALESQLIDVAAQLSAATLIVSNSLPVWLTLQSYTPVWLLVPNPNIQLYPSFAVPDNLQPPYGVLHIEPGQTEGLSSVAHYDALSGHSQIAADFVRITLYGATNDVAMAFYDLVQTYIEDTSNVGLMSIPAVRDEKRTQAELSVLAMKKTLEYRVSYSQGNVRTIARQLLKTALVTIYPQTLAA